MEQLAELRNNRDDADVTLNCRGVVIKAHSFILGFRYVCLTKVIEKDNLSQLLGNRETLFDAFVSISGLNTSRRP